MRRLIASVVFSGALAGIAAPRAVSQHADAASIVYVGAVDRSGAFVTGLGVEDFLIKEDGRDRQVLSVEPAGLPPHVAVVIDDNGTGVFGFGLARLAERLQGRAQMAFRVVTNQVQVIADFSSDLNVWLAAAGRAGVRPGTPEGGQLLEGIYETAKDLARREAHRPVILALTVGGDEQSPRLATQVLNEVWKSHASLHVVFVDGPAVRAARQTNRPADLLEGNFNLSRVLSDGPKESGGHRREVLATGAVVTEVLRVASDLQRQYVIAYMRPVSGNPVKLQVAARRPGVTITAPTRAPAR